MKKIELNKKMEKKLKEVEKKCSVRLFDLEYLNVKAESVLKRLSLFKKSDLAGLKIKVGFGSETSSYPSSYNGIPQATFCNLAFNGANWKIEDIYRKNDGASYIVGCSEDLEKYLLDRKIS